jgi:hypothetical protein
MFKNAGRPFISVLNSNAMAMAMAKPEQLDTGPELL